MDKNSILKVSNIGKNANAKRMVAASKWILDADFMRARLQVGFPILFFFTFIVTSLNFTC